MSLSHRMASCLTHYAQPYPRPAGRAGSLGGWGTKTIDQALDRGYLRVGAHGAHDLTDLGRAELARYQAEGDR